MVAHIMKEQSDGENEENKNIGDYTIRKRTRIGRWEVILGRRGDCGYDYLVALLDHESLSKKYHVNIPIVLQNFPEALELYCAMVEQVVKYTKQHKILSFFCAEPKQENSSKERQDNSPD